MMNLFYLNETCSEPKERGGYIFEGYGFVAGRHHQTENFLDTYKYNIKTY